MLAALASYVLHSPLEIEEKTDEAMVALVAQHHSEHNWSHLVIPLLTSTVLS